MEQSIVAVARLDTSGKHRQLQLILCESKPLNPLSLSKR